MRPPKKKFSKIYDEHIDKIYRFIYVKVNSQDVTEDLCSETFLKCWEIFKKDQNKIENIQAFLYRIARNLVIDHYREKGKVQIVSADSVSIIDPNVDLKQDTEISSDMNMIKNALADLKEDYQDVISWYYIDDLPISEIANMTKKSEGAVRVTIHRALSSLKEKINIV
ncbi:MAG: RNA polymerase sigma factor [Candidatus Nealsonbacteria bacterium]